MLRRINITCLITGNGNKSISPAWTFVNLRGFVTYLIRAIFPCRAINFVLERRETTSFHNFEGIQSIIAIPFTFCSRPRYNHRIRLARRSFYMLFDIPILSLHTHFKHVFLYCIRGIRIVISGIENNITMNIGFRTILGHHTIIFKA